MPLSWVKNIVFPLRGEKSLCTFYPKIVNNSFSLHGTFKNYQYLYICLLSMSTLTELAVYDVYNTVLICTVFETSATCRHEEEAGGRQ